MSILGACRINKNVEMAERISSEILKEYFDENIRASTYVTMANIYATAGLFDKKDEMIQKIKEEGLHKIPGMSWVHINGVSFGFIANEKNDKIRGRIKKLKKEFLIWYKEKFGKDYVPDSSVVANSMYKTQQEKEESLWYHSERYALVYGLMELPKGAKIIITKNLRICSDCHPVIEHLSEMLDREISVRDASRWHHFKNGKCSCGGYF